MNKKLSPLEVQHQKTADGLKWKNGIKLVEAFKKINERYGTVYLFGVAEAMNLDWDTCQNCKVETPTIKTNAGKVCIGCNKIKNPLSQSTAS